MESDQLRSLERVHRNDVVYRIHGSGCKSVTLLLLRSWEIRVQDTDGTNVG